MVAFVHCPVLCLSDIRRIRPIRDPKCWGLTGGSTLTTSNPRAVIPSVARDLVH